MLLLGNGRVITRDPAKPYLANGCVAMDGDAIVEVGDTGTVRGRHPGAEFVDAHGGVIMPGLINAHEHIYSAFARGLAIRGYHPEGFLSILDGLWWTLDRHLLLPETRLSADATMIDCIENGVTTIFDHHASYGEIIGSLFAIADSARQYGVRVNLCYEVSDRDGEQKMRAGVQENVDFIEYARRDKTGMLAGLFGMHAQFTLSDETLDHCLSKAPAGAGYHIHVAEGIEDVYACLKEHGKRPVYRLHDFGILGENTICGHCTHVSDAEIDMLRETGSNVAHNPESNMGNAIGCPPTLHMMHKGVCVGLGTDGYTNDMIESYKVGNIIHKHNLCDPTVAWGEIPTMLFENNPKIAGRFFKRPLGVLKPGAYADVIVTDYDPLTPMDGNNVNGHILFGMNGRSVVSTICNGKVLMKDRKVLVADEKLVMQECRASATKLWKSING